MNLKLYSLLRPTDFPDELHAFGKALRFPKSLTSFDPRQSNCFNFVFSEYSSLLFPNTDKSKSETLHLDNLPPSNDWVSAQILKKNLLIRFRNTCCFLVHHQSNLIECFLSKATDSNTLYHLILDQLVPRILALQGNPLLHASAVSINGTSEAIVFLGDSGVGKSSIAAYFCKQGASLITEDSLLISKNEKLELLATPAYPGIRLWNDSYGRFAPKHLNPDTALNTPPNKKHSLQFSNFPFDFCEQALPISAFYLLSPDDSCTEKIKIYRASKLDSIKKLVSGCFRLNIENSETLRREFEQLTEISKTIPVFHLQYPKCWDALDSIFKKILENQDTLHRLPQP